MPSYSRTILVGHLCRDSELHYLPGNQTPVADGSVAVNNKYLKNGEYVEEVSFFDFTIFGKRAETFCDYTGKGDTVLLEGRLKQERWETQDSQKRSKIKVIVDNFTFLKTKGQEKSEPQDEHASDAASSDQNYQEASGSDLAF